MEAKNTKAKPGSYDPLNFPLSITKWQICDSSSATVRNRLDQSVSGRTAVEPSGPVAFTARY